MSIKKELLEKRQLIKNFNIIIRLNKRLCLKLYLLNPGDEIFTDGTFTDGTLDIIKKEAKIVLKALELRKGK